MSAVDCEGAPVGATVDVCDGQAVPLAVFGGRPLSPVEQATIDAWLARGAPTIPSAPIADLLTRTLEAEADALSFPPAGSVWRSPVSPREGTVEYSPSGRRWRLLFDDGGKGDWCYEGIAEGWERVDVPAPAAPQAVTLETATINATEPGGYRSPADAHLPAPEVPRE